MGGKMLLDEKRSSEMRSRWEGTINFVLTKSEVITGYSNIDLIINENDYCT
jgi:hypothetical protein